MCLQWVWDVLAKALCLFKHSSDRLGESRHHNDLEIQGPDGGRDTQPNDVTGESPYVKDVLGER